MGSRPGASVGPRAFAAALGSAGLLLLAQPPFGFLPLPFLALVPLTLALASLPPGPAGRVGAVVLGSGFGVAFWSLSLVWVPLVVAPAFPWAYPGYLLLLVLLGGLSGLLGWLIHILRGKGGVPLGLAVPLAWVAVEWLKGNFPFGLAFPWLGLGVSLTKWPELLGLAELLGEGGVSFWLAGVNGIVAWGILEARGGWRPAPWAIAAVVVLLPAAGGHLRARTLPLEGGPTVLAVGTQVPRELRTDPVRGSEAALNQIRSSLRNEGPHPADLVVLPEATVAIPSDDPGAAGFQRAVEELASSWGVPVAFGALGGEPREGREGEVTNSVFLVDASGGLAGRYDKVRLVPGMELGRYRAGKGAGTLQAGGWTLGPLLCYESLFGRLAEESRRAGAQLLVNVSSDIWFGDGRSFLGSLFLRQHPAHLVLRAVELRMPVARAANGGFTFLMNPTGRVVSGTVPPSGGVARGRVSVIREATFFSRTGDWVGPGALLVSLGLLAAMRFRERWAHG